MGKMLGRHPAESRLSDEYDPQSRKEDVGIEVDLSVGTLADEKADGGWRKNSAPYPGAAPAAYPGTTGEG